MRKRIILDRADRMYQMPDGLDEFYPTLGQLRQLAGAEKISNILDLARPQWLSAAESAEFAENKLSSDALQPATKQQLSDLREAISGWAGREMSLRVDPVKEIYLGGGNSENLHLSALAYLDPGDLALYPNPGYPIYRQAILSHGAEPLGYQLTEKHGFKPRLKNISEKISRAARLLFLNNPHNPSGAELDIEELDELLWLAARDN
ncbi:aminotransferase class I/II-fold pyridoxal phosphate-dependent enzyme, partial [Gemmatimonas aurantiaca]|nr:aminotransferase class I/II-fold pyridoxal phosphate-dependent enzyme [Gemmatimonas aurantiaca]